MRIRPATVHDAEAILAIYNREVLESTATMDLVPRSLDEQRTYIADRSGGLAVIVAEVDERIAGFGGLSFFRDRPGYRTSVENSVYVDRDFHGRGIGDGLLAALLERAEAHGFHAVFARIAESAEASMRLHRKHGFELVGVEREVARKFGQWRDVAVMERLL